MANFRKKQSSRQRKKQAKAKRRKQSLVRRILNRTHLRLGRVVISTVAGLFVTLAGLVGVYYDLSSRLSLTHNTQRDVHSPLAGFFTLSNDGVTPVYNIHCEYTWPVVSGPLINARNNDAGPRNYDALELAANQKITVPVYFPMLTSLGNTVSQAEVIVRVSYRPKFWRTKQQAFRFVMTRDTDNVVHWLPASPRISN